MHGPGAKIQKSQDTTLTSEQQQALDRLIARYTARITQNPKDKLKNTVTTCQILGQYLVLVLC